MLSDTDKFKEMFEVPEMDDETRWLYAIGILGGPQSPFQILPAPDPNREYNWMIWDMFGKVYMDAMRKYTDCELNYEQARAYIVVATAVLANHLFGWPLQTHNLFGGLTELGKALIVLETGEMIMGVLPKLKSQSDEEMQAEYEREKAQREQHFKNEMDYWENRRAEKHKIYLMKVRQERLMTHTDYDRIRYTMGAIAEVAKEVWDSPVGKIAGIIGFAVGFGLALVGGVGLVSAVVIGGLLGYACKLLAGSLDVRYGSRAGDSVKRFMGKGMIVIDALETAWMTAFDLAWGGAELKYGGKPCSGYTEAMPKNLERGGPRLIPYTIGLLSEKDWLYPMETQGQIWPMVKSGEVSVG